MDMHFGEHLTIDGYGGDSEVLNSEESVRGIINELLEKLGMNVLYGPEVVFAPGNDFKDPGGWSGFVIIAESHISIHTFPLRKFVSADVYTCKNGMDVEAVKGIFSRTFKLKEIESNFIKRGLKYPSSNITE